MKITVGLGSIDSYIPFARAGADEVFCGYVPDTWNRRHGMLTPMNRREVVYCNVQVGSASELQILRRMMEVWKVPVTLTLNSLSYTPTEYPELVSYMQFCKKLGFSSFIIADPGLLVYLHDNGLSKEFTLHISGELGEINHRMLPLLTDLSAQRIIFHRKVSLPDMAAMTEVSRQQGLPLEFEAFLFNEMCHFHGGFCNSLHCDELSHICLVPYLTGSRKAGEQPGNLTESKIEPQKERPEGPEIRIEPSSGILLPGSSGCGLCALWKLQEAGVSWLKIVSRGASAEQTLSDIKTAKAALLLLEQAACESQYLSEMKQRFFPEGCSGNCYYLS